MKEFEALIQKADWKNEKHVPVIEIQGTPKKDKIFDVRAGVGKEIGHPNKTEHHIEWIQLFFLPEGGKYPYEIGKGKFSAHGASTEGPDTSSVYTHHQITFSFKTGKPGTIYAFSYCNIHGLWANSRELTF